MIKTNLSLGSCLCLLILSSIASPNSVRAEVLLIKGGQKYICARVISTPEKICIDCSGRKIEVGGGRLAPTRERCSGLPEDPFAKPNPPITGKDPKDDPEE